MCLWNGISRMRCPVAAKIALPKAGAEGAAQAHNILKVALLALIALHVLAVPFHRIVLKNNVMLRMIRPQI